ncbi:MAG: hypothetical protein NZ898_08395 [Myxococcota bacterium]|nr:hypothetical protein [Myxococcota bacterium]MDW8361924.1 hypothetical protein [Myxococcales bacterium]
MKLRVWWSALGVLVLCPAGCGSSDPPPRPRDASVGDAVNDGPAARDGDVGGGDGGMGVPLERFIDEYARAICSALPDCYDPDDYMYARVLLLGTEDCARVVAGLLERELRDALRSVELGAATYDPIAAATCVERVRTGCTVTTGIDLDDICNDLPVFRGTRSVGQSCGANFHCVPEAYCERIEATSYCGGVCRMRAAPGMPCTGSDAACRGDGSGPVECVEADSGATSGRCVVIRFVSAAEGERCGDLSASETEVRRAFCAAGLYCDGVCRRAISVGGACSDIDVPCAGRALCVQGTCREDAVVHAPGGACREETGPICNPFAGLVCRSGRCERVPRGEGAACASDDAAPLCAEGLVCISSTSQCGRPMGMGASCEGDEECISGVCDHDGARGTCREPTC